MGRKELRVDLEGTNILALDFDIHKISGLDDYNLLAQIVNILKSQDNCYLVASPSGSIHAYFNSTFSLKDRVGRTTSSLIPEVDYLKCINSPDMSKRRIIHVPSQFSDYIKVTERETPEIIRDLPELEPLRREFLPLCPDLSAKVERNIICQELPAAYPKCMHKGYRRRTLIAAIRVGSLGTKAINFINENFFLPAKPPEEIEDEILSKMETFGTAGGLKKDLIFEGLALGDIVYNTDDSKVFSYNKETHL